MRNTEKDTTVPGYKAVLIREETKRKLQALRAGLPDKDIYQERRIVTAALEYCLTEDSARQAMLNRVKDVVLIDLDGHHD